MDQNNAKNDEYINLINGKLQYKKPKAVFRRFIINVDCNEKNHLSFGNLDLQQSLDITDACKARFNTLNRESTFKDENFVINNQYKCKIANTNTDMDERDMIYGDIPGLNAKTVSNNIEGKKSRQNFSEYKCELQAQNFYNYSEVNRKLIKNIFGCSNKTFYVCQSDNSICKEASKKALNIELKEIQISSLINEDNNMNKINLKDIIMNKTFYNFNETTILNDKNNVLPIFYNNNKDEKGNFINDQETRIDNITSFFVQHTVIHEICAINTTLTHAKLNTAINANTLMPICFKKISPALNYNRYSEVHIEMENKPNLVNDKSINITNAIKKKYDEDIYYKIGWVCALFSFYK
ncbi:hypothetical protein COBT_000323 [Conglomerata obtusa]